MDTNDNVHSMGHRPRHVHYTLDGRRHKTTDSTQTAAQILSSAGLDPSRYDLGELCGAGHEPVHYQDDQEVVIENKARFVSIRHCADVA